MTRVKPADMVRFIRGHVYRPEYHAAVTPAPKAAQVPVRCTVTHEGVLAAQRTSLVALASIQALHAFGRKR